MVSVDTDKLIRDLFCFCERFIYNYEEYYCLGLCLGIPDHTLENIIYDNRDKGIVTIGFSMMKQAMHRNIETDFVQKLFIYMKKNNMKNEYKEFLQSKNNNITELVKYSEN